jgi:predicted DNA-binding transcriptional regulator AlpA
MSELLESPLLRDTAIRADLGGISESTLWRYRQAGLLPQPRKLCRQNVTPRDEYLNAKARLLARDAA